MAERLYGGLTLDEIERDWPAITQWPAVCALIARAREADGKEEGWRDLAQERFAELKRAQEIINGLRDYREGLLTCRADLEPAGRLRIVGLSNPPRDDHDRAVLLLVQDYERLLKAIIASPSKEADRHG